MPLSELLGSQIKDRLRPCTWGSDDDMES